MNHQFLLVFSILLGSLFSEILIKNGNEEFILKKGDIFSINGDKTKDTFETFDINLINNQIDVNLINSITIYKSKKLSGPLFKNIFIGEDNDKDIFYNIEYIVIYILRCLVMILLITKILMVRI